MKLKILIITLLMISFSAKVYSQDAEKAKALVADLVPPERRGIAFGVYNAAIGLTVFPASLLAGILWQGVGKWHGFGPEAPFYFGAALAILAGLLFWRLFPNAESG